MLFVSLRPSSHFLLLCLLLSVLFMALEHYPSGSLVSPADSGVRQ
jgi:hypothetical protein